MMTSLEHLRFKAKISSNESSEDEKGNLIINGQIVDLGTMENGSIANQEIPDLGFFD